MTETEQNALRVKVAELCPSLFEVHETYRDRQLQKYVSWKDDGEEIREREWLAFCAEFEETLTTNNCYWWELHRVVNGERLPFVGQGLESIDWFAWREIAHATALQRCRAFVKTMEGKQ